MDKASRVVDDVGVGLSHMKLKEKSKMFGLALVNFG